MTDEPAELSITAVLEHYGGIVSVPETGWRAVKCPFHEDRLASASVNIEMNGFRCHACGMSGDALKLIQRHENMSYGEALEFARTILGASVGSVPSRSAKRKSGRGSWRKTLFD